MPEPEADTRFGRNLNDYDETVERERDKVQQNSCTPLDLSLCGLSDRPDGARRDDDVLFTSLAQSVGNFSFNLLASWMFSSTTNCNGALSAGTSQTCLKNKNVVQRCADPNVFRNPTFWSEVLRHKVDKPLELIIFWFGSQIMRSKTKNQKLYCFRPWGCPNKQQNAFLVHTISFCGRLWWGVHFNFPANPQISSASFLEKDLVNGSWTWKYKV